MRNIRTLVALMLALLLMVPGLGCAVYGGLVHLEQIAPPILNVVVGPAHLIGGVSPPGVSQSLTVPGPTWPAGRARPTAHGYS